MDKVSSQDEKTAREDIEHYKDVVGVAYVGTQCSFLPHPLRILTQCILFNVAAVDTVSVVVFVERL